MVAVVALVLRRWRLALALVLLVPAKLVVEHLVVKQLVERERPGTTICGSPDLEPALTTDGVNDIAPRGGGSPITPFEESDWPKNASRPRIVVRCVVRCAGGCVGGRRPVAWKPAPAAARASSPVRA